jgi:signal transduction histidine kinase
MPASGEQAARLTSEEIPSRWLELLLEAMAQAPIEQGAAEAVGALLDLIHELLPGHVVGVCLALPPSRVLVRRGPAERMEGASPEPSRLFPSVAHERVAPLLVPPGSSFHWGHDDLDAVLSMGPEARFLERAGEAVAAVVKSATLLAEARSRAEEVRRLQAQVVQSEKLAGLGQLAAGVVHELNNPLTSIITYTEFLRKKVEQSGIDPDDAERLGRIGEAAERVRRFTRGLIDYARPSSGEIDLVSLHGVIDQALGFCEYLLREGNVEVERVYDTHLASVSGVGGELTQIFVNLITNACHALPLAGGKLVIATRMARGLVVVEVRDNGHGIDPDDLERIFDPFFTTKAQGAGTGLGLSIVRNLVQQHGGTVRASSPPGQGALFLLELPAA